MAQEKKGLIARMLEGKERSEEYARSTLPTNRWQLFWDIFKGNFGKIVRVNLLIVLFFIPLFAVIILRNVIDTSNGITYPFGANLGVGYPAVGTIKGLSETLHTRADLSMFLLLAISSFIFSVGLSGGMYVVRNMVWTEGIFVSNDFWKGVKLNYKNALQASLFYTLILTFCNFVIDMTDVSLVVGEISKWQSVWFKISRVVSIGLIALATCMAYWMIALGVNYKNSFFQLLKNSFLMTIGMFPQTVFFIALSLLPFLLFAIGQGLAMILAIFVVLLFALAYILLVWLDFAQWAFDKFINPKIEGAKVGRGIYNKDGTSSVQGGESEAEKAYNRAILAAGKSDLVARPIKPIDDSLQVYELPEAFTREDLKRLKDSKQNIADDTAAYEEEHKNDLRYVEYNKQFEERQRALKEDDEKKKSKKAPKNLKK